MKISELTSAGAITGTEVLPIVQSGETRKVTIDDVLAGTYTPPYKVYSALVSQSGTNAPTAIVLENTIGAITFGYSSIGFYTIISDNLFIEDKTWTTPGYNDVTLLDISIFRANTNTLWLQVGSGNDSLFKTSIEIRVYN
jgi:hypothetical protein